MLLSHKMEFFLYTEDDVYLFVLSPPTKNLYNCFQVDLLEVKSVVKIHLQKHQNAYSNKNKYSMLFWYLRANAAADYKFLKMLLFF